jgi:putative DNA primase/helicase
MGKDFKIIAYEVPYGYPEENRRMVPGYVLENGIVLLESEKDEDGSYKGGAGMDGMYLQTGQRYTPVFDGNSVPIAFALCSERESITARIHEPHLYDNIPAMLKQKPNWVCWGIRGAPPKSPYNPASLLSGRPSPAKAGIRETWGSYQAAAECVIRGLAQGIGYEFDGGVCGVGLDHVIDNGTLAPQAKDIVGQLASYTEVSPSGTGLHVFVLAPGANITRHRKKDYFLEIYSAGRYFTVTGNVYGGVKPIETRTAELQAIHDKYLLPEPAQKAAHLHAPVPDTGQGRFLRIELERDKVFAALWNGTRRNGNESADDIALMNKLAYWCNADPDAVIRAFLSSPYHAQKDEAHRKKCQRTDYLANTAKNACATVYSTAAVDYNRWQQSHRRERSYAR